MNYIIKREHNKFPLNHDTSKYLIIQNGDLSYTLSFFLQDDLEI